MRVLMLIVFCAAVGWGMASFFAPSKPAATGQSVDHRQIRRAMFNAADRLENSPCDPKLREPLRTAIVAYIADAQSTHETPDSSVKAVAKGALMARVVSLWDMSGFAALTWKEGDINQTFESSQRDASAEVEPRRFVCGGSDIDWQLPQPVERPEHLPLSSSR